MALVLALGRLPMPARHKKSPPVAVVLLGIAEMGQEPAGERQAAAIVMVKKAGKYRGRKPASPPSARPGDADRCPLELPCCIHHLPQM